MTELVFKYFDSFVKLSPESKEIISSHLEFEVIPKGEFLWKAGQLCTGLHFIRSGIARIFFYDEKGEEHTVHFVNQNVFVADLESLNSSAPSSVSCSAATDCDVIIISQGALTKFNSQVFEWHELTRKITEKILFEKIKVRDIIFQKEARERYLAFLQFFPSVAAQVPAYQVASYLGMSQFTLSHLKKEIAKSDLFRFNKN
jgi:CRP-like cAMP-binding protein